MTQLLKLVESDITTIIDTIDHKILHTFHVNRLIDFIYYDKTPEQWKNGQYHKTSNLNSWFKEFIFKNETLTSWLNEGRPVSFNFRSFFSEEGLINASKHEQYRLMTFEEEKPLPLNEYVFVSRVIDECEVNYKFEGLLVRG